MLFIATALSFTLSCNSSSPESTASALANEKVESPSSISSRPPQEIDVFITNMNKAVSPASPLTEAQQTAIRSLLEDSGFQQLTRLQQRELRPGLRNTIRATILTVEQAAALDQYMKERSTRNQQQN